MPENNFENNVHQKLDELEILPSDKSWQVIHDALHKKKDRGFPFWLLLLIPILAVGVYFLLRGDDRPIAQNEITTEKRQPATVPGNDGNQKAEISPETTVNSDVIKKTGPVAAMAVTQTNVQGKPLTNSIFNDGNVDKHRRKAGTQARSRVIIIPAVPGENAAVLEDDLPVHTENSPITTGVAKTSSEHQLKNNQPNTSNSTEIKIVENAAPDSEGKPLISGKKANYESALSAGILLGSFADLNSSQYAYADPLLTGGTGNLPMQTVNVRYVQPALGYSLFNVRNNSAFGAGLFYKPRFIYGSHSGIEHFVSVPLSYRYEFKKLKSHIGIGLQNDFVIAKANEQLNSLLYNENALFYQPALNLFAGRKFRIGGEQFNAGINLQAMLRKLSLGTPLSAGININYILKNKNTRATNK